MKSQENYMKTRGMKYGSGVQSKNPRCTCHHNPCRHGHVQGFGLPCHGDEHGLMGEPDDFTADAF